MADRWGCPYFYCQEHPLLVGPNKSVIRKHPYDGYGTCPGSGYDIKSPGGEQDRLMAERANAMHKKGAGR